MVCPGDLGYNMSVAGDVTSGTAYIYGTGPNDMTIYYWKLQDGQLVTPANQPNKLRYGPGWKFLDCRTCHTACFIGRRFGSLHQLYEVGKRKQ